MPSHTPVPSGSASAAPSPSRIILRTSDGLVLRGESIIPPIPVGNVVLCHPHPLHGGNMFAPVIDTLFVKLAAAGFACVRFNFRGVTGSDGRHGYGEGEQLDVLAAIDYLNNKNPGLPVSLVGWSFGADVSLAITHPAVSQWFCIAAPLSVLGEDQMPASQDLRPIVLAVPEHDQFCSPAKAEATILGWQNTVIKSIPDTDHFLNGRLPFVTDLALSVLPRTESSNTVGD